MQCHLMTKTRVVMVDVFCSSDSNARSDTLLKDIGAGPILRCVCMRPSLLMLYFRTFA